MPRPIAAAEKTTIQIGTANSFSEPEAIRACEMGNADGIREEAALKGTIAGRIGLLVEGISDKIGFDYRTNIALIGGFVAKEVIVSSLGTAYSLGEMNSKEGVPLSEKLKNDPSWNPLVAFTLIIFIMLYVPCFITVISIRRESSWKWAFFSMGFNLVAAYLVSLAVYQVGLALGVGV